ncbi:unnamed protein product [Peniophora sp. CBMAI 1063]|nr:unnamed protein product [Peniophora sp. CBMAI 1063]
MPKAPSSGAANSSGRPSLRRNQACLSCRKRKLKCDAQRPHCGTCVKQWQTQISVPPPPGYQHPVEPQCSYDPVEGLPLAPDIDPQDKIRELEEQVSQLKRKLKGSKNGLDRDGSGSPSSSHTYSPSQQHAARSSPLSPSSGNGGLPSDFNPRPNATTSPISLPHVSLGLSPMSVDRLINDDNNVMNINRSARSDSLKSLIHLGWNPELPEPATLERYVDVFFKCDPCGSRILHRPSFLAALHLPPKNPDFPHSAILHAICASASRWVSKEVVVLPDGTRRDRFAEFHSRKTREYIDNTMASGADIFQVMQACILLSWYFYSEGRWVEVWIFAGFQARVAVPLRLNYQGTFATHNSGSPGAYLPPPKDPLDLELRRRAWWMTILFDRIVSVGGWVHALDERDIGTEFPLRAVDFEVYSAAMDDNPQHLWTPNLYTDHPIQYTDSGLLLLKAMMLFGRVTDFGVRTNLRKPPVGLALDPFRLPGFEELDRLVCGGFLDSLPGKYHNPLLYGDADSVYSNGGLDTDLYMVHMIPHAATITLHNPYIDIKNDPQGTSVVRCISASEAILQMHRNLTSTNYDLSRLHPFATICWYLAAVVQVQLCKYFIERGESDKEYATWGVINVLRFAMSHYGLRSPIGTRQEKLLQGLMTEIVRMTTQPDPLDVTIPLYPFSHTTAFAKGDGESTDTAHTAPLPIGSDFHGDHSLGGGIGLSPSHLGLSSHPLGVPLHSQVSPDMLGTSQLRDLGLHHDTSWMSDMGHGRPGNNAPYH